jgi:hypothetical protein
MAARGSIGTGASRLLIRSMRVTCAARAKAASTAPASPIAQSQQTLRGTFSQTSGAES